MSYANWGRILLASLALSACAHGGSSVAAAPIQLRHTDGPGPSHVRATLGDEGHPQLSEGQAVALELDDCNVWVLDHGQCRSPDPTQSSLALHGASYRH